MRTGAARSGVVPGGADRRDHRCALARANWVAQIPTAPAPPCINTVRPSTAPPTWTQRCAVMAGMPRHARCANETLPVSGTACEARGERTVRLHTIASDSLTDSFRRHARAAEIDRARTIGVARADDRA